MQQHRQPPTPRGTHLVSIRPVFWLTVIRSPRLPGRMAQWHVAASSGSTAAGAAPECSRDYSQRSPDFPFHLARDCTLRHLFVGRQGNAVGTFRQFAAVDGRRSSCSASGLFQVSRASARGETGSRWVRSARSHESGAAPATVSVPMGRHRHCAARHGKADPHCPADSRRKPGDRPGTCLATRGGRGAPKPGCPPWRARRFFVLLLPRETVSRILGRFLDVDSHAVRQPLARPAAIPTSAPGCRQLPARRRIDLLRRFRAHGNPA